MNRWLEKLGNAQSDELTQLTKRGSVSFGSASPGAFEEKKASGNRWLAKLNKAPPAPEGSATGPSTDRARGRPASLSGNAWACRAEGGTCPLAGGRSHH